MAISIASMGSILDGMFLLFHTGGGWLACHAMGHWEGSRFHWRTRYVHTTMLEYVFSFFCSCPTHKLFSLFSVATGEKLDVKTIQGIGDKRVLNGELQKVGAGGIGGGVKLAVSDSEVQQRNRKMLETYLKRERKRRRREAKEQQ